MPSSRVTTRPRPTRRRSASLTRSIASQNRRWSTILAVRPVIRPSEVVADQSAKPAFERGSQIRLSAASARYVFPPGFFPTTDDML